MDLVVILCLRMEIGHMFAILQFRTRIILMLYPKSIDMIDIQFLLQLMAAVCTGHLTFSQW